MLIQFPTQTVQNMYDAIQNAAGNIALIMDPFIAAFDPPQDPSIAEKLALDVLMMAYALAAAPIWSNCEPQFRSETADWPDS